MCLEIPQISQISTNFVEFNTIAAKREEARKARILFGIIIIFVVCNIPRIVLNLEELAVIAPSYWKKYNFFYPHEMGTKNEEQNLPICYSPPFWVHVLGSISKFLLTLNASVCFFVYCVICRSFRSTLSKRLRKLITLMLKRFRPTQI